MTIRQSSTTPLNRPICQNSKCKKMKKQLSDLKLNTLMGRWDRGGKDFNLAESLRCKVKRRNRVRTSASAECIQNGTADSTVAVGHFANLSEKPRGIKVLCTFLGSYP